MSRPGVHRAMVLGLGAVGLVVAVWATLAAWRAREERRAPRAADDLPRGGLGQLLPPPVAGGRSVNRRLANDRIRKRRLPLIVEGVELPPGAEPSLDEIRAKGWDEFSARWKRTGTWTIESRWVPVLNDRLSPNAYAELAPGAIRPQGGPPPNGKLSWRSPEERAE